MAKRSRQTYQKHQKEQARRQKQQQKAARRLQAQQRRVDAASAGGASSLEVADRLAAPLPALARGERAGEST
jgi:hypothetical protein